MFHFLLLFLLLHVKILGKQFVIHGQLRLTMRHIVRWHYGRGHNFCLQKSRIPMGRIGIFTFQPVDLALSYSV